VEVIDYYDRLRTVVNLLVQMRL